MLSFEGYCEHVCSVAEMKINIFSPFIYFLNGKISISRWCCCKDIFEFHATQHMVN